MRNFLLLVFCFCFGTAVFSQFSTGGYPESFRYPDINDNFDVVFFNQPDVESLKAEDDINVKNGTMLRTGVAIQANLDMKNSGTWTELNDGGRVWRIKIIADKAVAIALDINEYNIPDDCRLFIYDESRSRVLGGFSSENNSTNGFFASDFIPGDEVILEYYEPENAIQSGHFVIKDISYVYRPLPSFITRGFGDSDPCEVNIICPEGDNWADEKHGVAKIYLRVGTEYGFCSGSLVNNTDQDCKPYFLTADHCGNGASTADLAWWRFYFNYDSPTCTNPTSEPSPNYTYGSVYVASGGNGGSNGSDFYLINIERVNHFPEAWNFYLNGWDRSTTASGGGVGIHHPNGDIKKISTYSATPVSTTWGSAAGSHWRVTWIATVTNHGVTEGGSSGSPLFNNSRRIIGDLTGGGSYCTATYYPDYYGKFSYSWESNGTTSTKQLKPWLDPTSTGVVTLDGKAYNDCFYTRIGKIQKESKLSVYPNPAMDEINVEIFEILKNQNVTVRMFNKLGELCLLKEIFVDDRKFSLNLNDLDDGLYLIEIQGDGVLLKEKIIILK
ncbi:MAG: T9SS type A sorting domain-containing protein [Bacteroidota bacterium]